MLYTVVEKDKADFELKVFDDEQNLIFRKQVGKEFAFLNVFQQQNIIDNLINRN